MTFYYHFKDIYDLVEWICYEDAAQALQGKKTYDTWQEGLLQVLVILCMGIPRFSLARFLRLEQFSNTRWGIADLKY